MADYRLPTEYWVDAQLRRFNAAGTGAYLVRRGDRERGSVIVRLSDSTGYRILTQIRNTEGSLVWMGVKDGAILTAEDADAYVSRAVARDSDLWIIEVETRPGEDPFQTNPIAP